MQALLKTEPEETDDEIVDIIAVSPPCQKLKVKEEEQEADMEPKFYLGPCVSSQFVSETAQQVKELESGAEWLRLYLCNLPQKSCQPPLDRVLKDNNSLEVKF